MLNICFSLSGIFFIYFEYDIDEDSGTHGGLIIHANIFEAVLLFILALVAVQITKSSSPNQ